VVFFANWLGGGLFIGIAYAWLNQTKTKHVEG
jgi:formate/nitrite transporter FocA (FNT family)